MAESLIGAAIRELALDVCFCGSKKKPRQSFCLACYRALPVKTQHKLYKTFDDGYAEIYDAAKTYLQAETDRIRK